MSTNKQQLPYMNNDPEEGFYQSMKEINPLLLQFNELKIENEYCMYNISKYRKLGYLVCFIMIIIFIADFVHLFQENRFPQKHLIFLVLMLVIPILVMIVLYFKQSLFNIIYSIYYCAYISLLGWSMFDINSESIEHGNDIDENTKIDFFTYGYTISALLILGITGTNYLVKIFLFTYATIMLYISEAIQHEASYQAIIRIILIILLYYYVTYQLEKGNRISYLKQIQINSYNNIMNNQISHCLFVAKFISTEQRVELFQCNNKAKKYFNIQGNEDFQKFISNSYLIQSSDKTEKSQVSVHATANTSTKEQSWENSLKGKIIQLINHKNQSEIQQSNKEDGQYTNSKYQTKNINNNTSQIIKFKLKFKDGTGSENKISVRLNIFKLYEYYVMITVDRNRKKKNKIKKEVRSKSGRDSTIQTKVTKQLTLENIRITNNEITLQQTEYTSPRKQKINSQAHHVNLSHEATKPNSIFQQTAAPNFPQNPQSQHLSSSKQSPSLQGQINSPEEDQGGLIKKNLSPKTVFQNNFRQNNHLKHSFSYGNIDNYTPPSKTLNNNQNDGKNHLQNIQNNDSNNTYSTYNNNNVNALGSKRKSILNAKQQSSNNNYLYYLTQKKLSLSAVGPRKPMNSINSFSSTNLPPSSNHINQPRTTSFATSDLQYQMNQRVSQGSRGVANSLNNNYGTSNYANQIRNQNQQSINNLPHNSNQNSNNKNNNANKGQIKEQMLDTCFEIIAQTLQLIQRYKTTAPNFRNNKISQYFLPQTQSSQCISQLNIKQSQLNSSINQISDKSYYDAFEKYTSSIMQQILITNSNFMKFTRLVFNQVTLKYSPFNTIDLINFLKEQIQPILVEKNIQLYLQDDFDAQIYSDSNTLKLTLINLLLYCASILNELEYVAIKMSLQDDSQTFKIQLSMPYKENHVFNHIDTLHQLELDQIQKDYFILHKFYIDLRVAFNMIKKLNNDNPNVIDYLKFSVSQPVNNHMYLTFTIPSLCNYQTSQSDLNNLQTNENNNSYQAHINSAAQLQRSEVNINLADKYINNSRSQNEITQPFINHISTKEITEECFLDDSISSLERWVTIKQYTAYTSDKQVKLIL